ncbi:MULTISPECIES: hypothetical protein [Paenibacillus]|uniref:hypothetical protein n=1 Tax=Paenibacillus TaxID=44249 RepID=UPI000A5909C2|nr:MULTISPECIES: hypothetical protein [Paenibacillus]NEN83963.1 hypothetical protein [Paenibacillus elgii]
MITVRVEELRTLKNDFLALQKFWGAEALERTDEAGQEFAKGVSYGFELAAAILEARK